MKRTIKLWFLALMSVALTASGVQAQQKLAVVDLQRVFDGYWRTKQADAQLKERAADFDKMRTNLFEDYKKASDDLRALIEGANDQAIASDERDRRRRDAEKKQGEVREMETSLRTFDQNSRNSILEQQKRMRESVLRDIRGVIEEKAKLAGHSMVVDTAAQSANQTPIVLYTSMLGGSDDLTDAILRQLNANAPADFAK
jgi:outer membrane protein